MNNDKIELSERTLDLLKITRKNINKFSKERKIAYNYLRTDRDDKEFLIEWQNFITSFEQLTKEEF